MAQVTLQYMPFCLFYWNFNNGTISSILQLLQYCQVTKHFFYVVHAFVTLFEESIKACNPSILTGIRNKENDELRSPGKIDGQFHIIPKSGYRYHRLCFHCEYCVWIITFRNCHFISLYYQNALKLNICSQLSENWMNIPKNKWNISIALHWYNSVFNSRVHENLKIRINCKTFWIC